MSNRRNFLKKSAAFASLSFFPSSLVSKYNNGRLRTAHVGVGGMGGADLNSIASHNMVDVVALCDVDLNALNKAKKLYPNAELFSDYRKLFNKASNSIDAVIVSTPDHTHAPASIMAMKKGKSVYCQKPLTHHVSEAREMMKLAEEKNLVTQMGVQIHSFDEYKSAVILIQSGIIGKVHTVRAWSPKNWGYDGIEPEGSDPIPKNLNWNLWLGTSKKRLYKDKIYHPGQWRKLLDYGCGTLGDMGVHIFDTPYSALNLDVPETVMNNCRESNGFGHPEKNKVNYVFPGTKYTTEKLKWVWYDGEGAPSKHKDLLLPKDEKLPEQGAIFIGEKGRLLLPHWDFPKLIINGKYEKLDYPKLDKSDHYHQFVDACLGKDECSTPFSYASRLTETILLGVIAGRFPNKVLHWNNKDAKFSEKEANEFLDVKYRNF